MPTFSFSSQGGTSLSDRIAAINARQKAKMSAHETEEEAEEAMMEQVKQDDEIDDAFKIDADKPVLLSRVGYVGEPYESLAEINKKLDALASDMKKMSKHVNSIVKMLKKG